jgi:hypothetical protein
MIVELWHQQCPPAIRKGEPWYWRATEHQVLLPLKLDVLSKLFEDLVNEN